MASGESKKVQAWGALIGEVLAILLGFWIISWGWTDFGWGLVAFGAVGFVISSVHLWRVLRHDSTSEELQT